MNAGKYPVLLATMCMMLIVGAASGEPVTITRDTFGIPHIEAATPTAAAYGLGYAQAEDRLEDLFQNVHTALGTMSEHFGPEHVEIDMALRLVRNAKLCEEYWPKAQPEVRALCDAFVAGVKAYMAEHPERVPEYAVDLQGWQCAAIGRTMLLQWPLGQLKDELGERPKGSPFASNAWAVAPGRSADKCPVLLTDPHLEWKSLAVFYEARVHGGGLAMNGYFLVGTPVLAIGHNENVGWACTTGGPDTSDVYALKVRPAAMGFEYEYDGKWLAPRLSMLTIKVKGEAPRVIPVAQTQLGPLLMEPDLENGVAYAGKTAFMDDTGFLEQQYAMCMAGDADAFYEAMRRDSFMEQNVLYADRKGNIGYLRAGRTPIRPDGYDWSKPVPGNTSATAWLGIHSIDDHVRIVNPPQGYMQNCNVIPSRMMPECTLTADKYKPYIYGYDRDRETPRGQRALDLLAADDQITKDEAMAIVMDVFDLRALAWQKALRAAMNDAPEALRQDTRFTDAVAMIDAWNGQYTQDSAAAGLVRLWRLKCGDRVPVSALVEGRTLGKEENTALLEVLKEALDEMKALYGKDGVTWGEIQQVGRNGDFYPCDGADFGGRPDDTETLRNVESEETPPGSGRYLANSGSFAAMLMFFHADGVDSYTCTPWGISADPASPHHTDQSRELYSKRRMKPTWFTKASLEGHIESEKTLEAP